MIYTVAAAATNAVMQQEEKQHVIDIFFYFLIGHCQSSLLNISKFYVAVCKMIQYSRIQLNPRPIAIVLLFTGLLQIITVYICAYIQSEKKPNFLNKKRLLFILSKMKTLI